MRKASLALQQTPGFHTKRQGYLWKHVPFLEQHVTSASGGSTVEGLKSELMGEGNMCSLSPALRRLPPTYLLYQLLQPNCFLMLSKFFRSFIMPVAFAPSVTRTMELCEDLSLSMALSNDSSVLRADR